MNWHDLSNERVVVDNAKSVEKREETVWEKMASMWNNENFPIDNGVIPKIVYPFCCQPGYHIRFLFGIDRSHT